MKKNASGMIYLKHMPHITTHAESGLDRRLRHITTLNPEQNQLAIKVLADN